MLSGTAQYALRAVLHLAQHARSRPIGVDEIASALGIPRSYLSKTLQVLARAGVVTSTLGRGGGYRLAIPPGKLRLARVVAPFDEERGARFCLLGPNPCSDGKPCIAHHAWKDTSSKVDDFFRTTTVADVLVETAG